MSFNRHDIETTRRLAREVAALCDEAMAELVRSAAGHVAYSNPKLSGTLRRRSVDLTRALAQMRKP